MRNKINAALNAKKSIEGSANSKIDQIYKPKFDVKREKNGSQQQANDANNIHAHT
jgi:hypothetical protein